MNTIGSFSRFAHILFLYNSWGSLRSSWRTQFFSSWRNDQRTLGPVSHDFSKTKKLDLKFFIIIIVIIWYPYSRTSCCRPICIWYYLMSQLILQPWTSFMIKGLVTVNGFNSISRLFLTTRPAWRFRPYPAIFWTWIHLLSTLCRTLIYCYLTWIIVPLILLAMWCQNLS